MSFEVLGCSSHLEAIARAEVDGHEGEPDDAGGVHGEADELCLVEILGHVASFDCVQRTEADQHKVKAKWCGDSYFKHKKVTSFVN